MIAAVAPWAPRPGHTRSRAIWKPRLSRGEEHRKGAKQTYFNNAKNNRVDIPFCLGSRGRSLNAPSQLSSPSVPGGESLAWVQASCLPDQAPRRCLWGPGGVEGGLCWRDLHNPVWAVERAAPPVSASRRTPDPGRSPHLTDGQAEGLCEVKEKLGHLHLGKNVVASPTDRRSYSRRVTNSRDLPPAST